MTKIEKIQRFCRSATMENTRITKAFGIGFSGGVNLPISSIDNIKHRGFQMVELTIDHPNGQTICHYLISELAELPNHNKQKGK